MAQKIDRKQLKRPDEFQVLAARAMEWTVAHQGRVLAALGAVVVVALAAWGLVALRSSREARAGAALADALAMESRPIAGDPQAQAQPGEETFPDRKARDQAALDAFAKVRAEHGGTAAATTALAEQAFVKLRTGDASGAQTDLQDFLQAAPSDHPLRPIAQSSLGYALEAQGKLDEARAAFEKLRDLGLPDRADYQAARLALEAGKPDARQALEKVAKDYPKDPAATDANERLELAALPPVQPGQAAPAAAPAPSPSPAKKTAPAKGPRGKKKK